MEPSLSATLLTTAQVPCSEGPRAETCPPLYAHTQNPPRAAKRAAYCDFVCRVDILWTILFFVLLFSVGLCTSVVTQTLLSTAVLESWHKLHALHVNVTSKQLSQQISAAYGLAVHILPLQVRYPVLMQSEDTLATLCALLTAYDKYTSFDTLSVTSLTLQEAIACIHGFTDDESTDSLAGYVSYNHTVNATYYVDKDTYHFQRPLRAAMVWPFAARNVSSIINESTSIAPISRATHNPSIGHRNAWRVHPILPHLMEMEVPIGIEYRDPLAPEITSPTMCTCTSTPRGFYVSPTGRSAQVPALRSSSAKASIPPTPPSCRTTGANSRSSTPPFTHRCSAPMSPTSR
ncbi:hypothetical_protein [Leishmania braziliensis MHOM/BR/75/M2904]|uniref:Hypothetical_protein n=1 Tax=Leishmania braziliensis MHOM/BR/75/M2904 TaxID=420245 RepID=A0A3P3ZDQ8_LEIBR|nr:hypothetical_protein [Leishmania braziliensis MHOM/BR/75/M2904]